MANERDDERWGNDERDSRDRFDDRDRFDNRDRDRPDSRDLAEARSKVKGPAIALMITSVFAMLSLAAGVFQYFVTMPQQFEDQRRQVDADPKTTPQAKKEIKEILDAYERVVMIALPADWILVGISSILIFAGALKMKGLQSRGWARASAILAMIPCVSGCCLLGLPFGIWALMVLGNEEVKRGFAYAASRGNERDNDLR